MSTRAKVIFEGPDQRVTLYLPYDGDPAEVKARILRARRLSTSAFNTGDLAAMFCYACVESAINDIHETFGYDTGVEPDGNVVQICNGQVPATANVEYVYAVRYSRPEGVVFDAVNTMSGKVLYHGPFDDCPTSYWQEDE